MDDIIEIVRKDQVTRLTDHLNQADNSNSIKFTYELETNDQISFLDTLIVRKDDGSVKLLIYRKKSHTDQYLDFKSHHPLNHKLGVIRTLFDRCDNIVSEQEDKNVEREHIQNALQRCGYPRWSFEKVKRRMNSKKRDKDKDSIGMVVMPYVKGITEQCQRVFKSYNITSAAKPVKTLRNILVHPKDKRDIRDCTGVVYSIPCSNCDFVYVGETSRSFGTRLDEHKKEVESKSTQHFTRSHSKIAEFNKSAITDHALQYNHVIDWDKAKILENDSNKFTRWVRESIHIRQNHHHSMNRDCGQYHLDTTYNTVLRRRRPHEGAHHNPHQVTRDRDLAQ